MSVAAPTPTALAPPRADAAARRQLRLLLAVALVIGAADQLAKAWAWRHVAVVHINSGSGVLFGDRAGAVYRDRQLGPVLDGIAVALVAGMAAVLVQRRRPTVLLLGAALVLGGWASNLGDRLGLHAWTAPGTRRGVVDFLRWDGRLWNVADLAIIAGTGTCLLAALWSAGTAALAGRQTGRPPSR